MHRKDIVHQDLKPENILLEDKDLVKGVNSMPTIKLIDFGTAKLLMKPEKENMNFNMSKAEIKQLNWRISDPKGTWMYMAPEVQKLMWKKQNEKKGDKDENLKEAIKKLNECKYYDEKGYDEKCDIWSVGVIAYTVLCEGEHPFQLDASVD